MMFTFNSCRFIVVCVLSLMLSAKADTIRGALNQSAQRKLSTALSPSTLGWNNVPLPPDEYTASGIVTLPGILFLNTTAADTTSTWTFTFESGAFVTAADSSIQFLVETPTGTSGTVDYKTIEYGHDNYEALAARVTWEVMGAITLGASSKVGGTMRSQETITTGASAKCDRLEARAAIVLGASAHTGPLIGNAAITVGAGASCGPIHAGAAITVGAGATISVLRPGSGAAITVGAGVECEPSTSPVVWLVSAQCTCDTTKYPTTTANLVASTFNAIGNDCA
jgi:hypothetical protein